MIRTAPNFSNSTNRVPAHSLRHQTAATQLTTLLQQLPVVGKPDKSITECSRVPQLKDENVCLLLHGNAIKYVSCLTVYNGYYREQTGKRTELSISNCTL